MKRFRSRGMLGDAVPKGRARRRRQGGARADPVRALKCAPRTSLAITHFTTNRCNPSRALQTGRPLHFPNPNFAPIRLPSGSVWECLPRALPPGGGDASGRRRSLREAAESPPSLREAAESPVSGRRRNNLATLSAAVVVFETGLLRRTHW